MIWLSTMKRPAKNTSQKAEQNVALSYFLSLQIFSASSHASPRAHRSCLAVSSGDLSSNFTAKGLRWWIIFDLYFTQRQTFISSDVRLTRVDRTRRIGSNTLFALPGNRCRIWRLSVLWHTTQLSYTFHNSNCTLASTLFRLFLLVVLQPSSAGNGHSAPNLHPDSVLQNWHSGGCQCTQGDLVQVPTRRSTELLRLASASGISFSRHTST